MSQIATHPGEVTKVEKGKITVLMHVLSACSSCKGHEKCAFVDKADKVVEVKTSDWEKYSVGDSVIVSVNESLGLLAVLLAYLLPAIIIIGSVILISIITHSELLAAIIPIAITVLYFFILYRVRGSLERKFSFGIEKMER